MVVTTVGRLGRRHRRRDRAGPTLDLLPLPDDLRAAIDEKLPPRWSRNNPIDLAGAETRDTIPEVLELVAAHPAVDAVILLGIGIQSNQARLMRTGDVLSRSTGSSGSSSTTSARTRGSREAAADGVGRAPANRSSSPPSWRSTDPDNAGPARGAGDRALLRPVGDRAVTALEHLWRYAALSATDRGG